MLSTAEIQELHECIGVALESVRNGQTSVVYELERALELAALLVSDTEAKS